MTYFDGETVYANADKTALDYTAAHTVYEMMVSAPESGHSVIIMTEKLQLANTKITEEQYLEILKTQFDPNEGFRFSDGFVSAIIAGHNYTMLTAESDVYLQLLHARKIGDRINLIILTSASDSEARNQAMGLLEAFQPYTAAQNNITGIWTVYSDNGVSIEFAFNGDGRFYMLRSDNADFDVSEGSYTVSGDRIHITTSAGYHNYGDGIEESGMWRTGNESFAFSVSGDTLTMTDESGITLNFTNERTLGIWSFEHKDNIVPVQPTTAPDMPVPTPSEAPPSPSPQPSPSTAPSPSASVSPSLAPSPSPSATPSPSASASPPLTPSPSPSAAPTSVTIGGETFDVNVTVVELRDKSLVDISALKNLTKLKELNLTGNSVSDLSPLSGINSLEKLYLARNSISNISSLSGLTNLKNLVLSGNSQLSNISALSGLTKLEQLAINDTSISNISALSGLTNLNDLNLVGNKISDISALSKLTKLTWLDLSNNSITDVSALKGLTSLKFLILTGNTISQEQKDELTEALTNCKITF
jgi:hypothetical protein